MQSMQKNFVTVANKKIAYYEKGKGNPIIFLHGNPTSSYLWRNITPHMCNMGRCISIDLIGMGNSDKLDQSDINSYKFEEHYHYLNQTIKSLTDQNNITFVLHDWGSALGFHWSHKHPNSIMGIAYMEAIINEMTWDDWNENSRSLFQGFRSEAGESLILDKNYFIEKVLPGSIIRDLDESEMNEYRKPFLNSGEDRRPTLSWPREIPMNGKPENVCKLVNAYADWMQINDIPKLFINAEPGVILTGRMRDLCRTWKNQKEVSVKGLHFIQEDSPTEIGNALSSWYKDIFKS
ncbi:MAG: haloalkane dehalogenase [Gammaproteobacteria bacterium]|jgi:haloalkane dehalogenase|nr:haloalkane dehalogenase [Gammaproteobacteria bacterium]MBT5217102.1 haloalkane dehalogenase [Gammaproteobacteria bacterium]MBT5541955.1 haloalkane dehalogenase [Gammaproteobacteria bacterium]MBT6074732.1 haloalkane dehalogenase [Gammaproteobacteria bacterium]MBT7753633.1 haloalkane dehalogenase [Gammaproteobacteria bacterium]